MHKPANMATRIPQNVCQPWDPWLMTVILFLLGFGLILVASSSIAIAERHFQEPLYYFWRQLAAVVLGLILGFIALKIPLVFWQKLSVPLMLLGLLLLTLVLLPGLGKEINGSNRWLQIGSLTLQASELVKFCLIVYLANYMVRHGTSVRTRFIGFAWPISILIALSVLLLLEPDYGACVVMLITALGMLFMGGAPLSRLVAWAFTIGVAFICLAVLSPYRRQRLMSFANPWQDPFDSGFQLTQALIAIGRGDWFGVNLGGSVQKLFYLPEAHTDFSFAVFAEEFGLIGIVLVISLFSFLLWKAFSIGHFAECRGRLFAAYLAYGIGLVIGTQVFINIGVNLGMLPTKGLTLPLLSYGNNSVVVTCLLLSVLLRVETENRQDLAAEVQAHAT